MTAPHASAWRLRARALADQLEASGDLRDPAWKAAIAEVPRHVLVPEIYEQDTYGEWNQVDMTTPNGLARVYSPTTLVTALADRGAYWESMSSSTKPDLMVRMLEVLDIRDGHTVLEVGTGTGYNSALLTHRLGDERVFSVDLDTALVDPARGRLASIGLYPALAARHGAEGWPEHAPFDRIIATCSVPIVPCAWAEQLVEGGLLLADIKVGTGAGNLVRLRREGERLEGRFTPWWGAFMPMRHEPPGPLVLHPPTDHGAQTRTTNTPPNPWQDNRVVWFLAHLTGLPQGARFGMRLDPDTRQPTAATITATDGSHAFVMVHPTPEGTWPVTESGPTPLWNAVEHAHQHWLAAGEPDWTQLGMTVTAADQWVWIDEPHGKHQWSLTMCPTPSAGIRRRLPPSTERQPPGGVSESWLCR